MAKSNTKQELEADKIPKQPEQVADMIISWQQEEDTTISWHQEMDKETSKLAEATNMS